MLTDQYAHYYDYALQKLAEGIDSIPYYSAFRLPHVEMAI